MHTFQVECVLPLAMPPAGKEGSALSALSCQGDDPPGPSTGFAYVRGAVFRAKPVAASSVFTYLRGGSGWGLGVVTDAPCAAGDESSSHRFEPAAHGVDGTTPSPLLLAHDPTTYRANPRSYLKVFEGESREENFFPKSFLSGRRRHSSSPASSLTPRTHP